MNYAWYDPIQFTAALGVTLPLFIIYSYRIYSLILDHHEMLKKFLDPDYITVLHNRDSEEGSQNPDMLLGYIFTCFDRDVVSRRRSIRADVYTVILLGFVGTLIGMCGAFWSFVGFAPLKTEPVELVTGLIKGGLATALISSLVAGVIGSIAVTYLSSTEQKVAQARATMLKVIYLDGVNGKGRNGEDNAS